MNIGVCGIGGRMGVSVLLKLLERGHKLVAAFDRDDAPSFGCDAGTLIHRENMNVAVTGISGDAVGASEGIIDFSSPAATMMLLSAARAKRTSLVIGTTGFSPEERADIERAARDIPIIFSPNMSLGVNLLFKLTEVAARALTSEYDVEIFEAHHRFKKDAPSGTARRLLEIVKSGMRGLGNAREVFGREGITGERTRDEIGVMAMRGGDIVGEHTVFFTGIGERIELTHRAASREILAAGAVAAAEFLSGRPAGLYSMYDVLGF
ncbi:MAG: 4-hydroxy-tetrahydrodipicolinate reductase [Spirochaetes bacterium RBG_13_51_14]|nr:MAG: 4-hydroxy-tetrahydrodipicolinate reductase [Spirochaetes bacterium RBG_13_51_14]